MTLKPAWRHHRQSNKNHRIWKALYTNTCLVLVGALLSSCQPAAPVLPDHPMDSPSPARTPSLIRLSTQTAALLQATATIKPSLTLTQGKQVSVSPPIQPPSPTSTPQPASYFAQSGDTLTLIAWRFKVQPEEIKSPDPLSQYGLVTPGQLLWLPPQWSAFTPSPNLLPDSEIVFSPSAINFDTSIYLNTTRGYLKNHREYLHSTGWTSAADILIRVALENSINPRLLLALLEYQCGCVLGSSSSGLQDGYALGVKDFHRKGLYGQLWWAANQLSTGYYGWREGRLKEILLPNGVIFYPKPDANAGSVAMQYYFSSLWAAHDKEDKFGTITWATLHPISFGEQDWVEALDPQAGFPAFYQEMFGNAWERAAGVEPLLPAGLTQPILILPFEPDRMWSFTSGPHRAWESEGSRSALDFAPATYQSGCIPTEAWVGAVANGSVVRTAPGLVVQDLDGPLPSDGLEQTGWSILYMHVDTLGLIKPGDYLHAGDPIGHPACIGGPATGTHLHIARKYNGEWIAAGGPLPFVLSGWTAQDGNKPYEGTLNKDGQTVVAHPYGSFETLISRPGNSPTPLPTQAATP